MLFESNLQSAIGGKVTLRATGLYYTLEKIETRTKNNNDWLKPRVRNRLKTLSILGILGQATPTMLFQASRARHGLEGEGDEFF